MIIPPISIDNGIRFSNFEFTSFLEMWGAINPTKGIPPPIVTAPAVKAADILNNIILLL